MAGTAIPTPGEGTVDYAAAKKFFTEGTQTPETPAEAGETTPVETPVVTDVEVSIRGRKVRMTAEAADAYADFVKETRERDGRLGGEISSLRERTAKAEGMIETLRAPAAREAEIKPPDPRLAQTDLAAWQAQWVAFHDAKSARLALDLEAKFNRDQNQSRAAAEKEKKGRDWADRFYRSHKHLNDPHLKPLVLSVYNENIDEIDGLEESSGIKDAQERLAELSDERIVAIRSAGQTNTTARPPRLEGPGGNTKRDVAPPERVVTAASWSARKQAELRGDKIRSKE